MQERRFNVKLPDFYWTEVEEIVQHYNVPIETYISALLANEVHMVLTGDRYTLGEALGDYKEPQILEFLNTIE